MSATIYFADNYVGTTLASQIAGFSLYCERMGFNTEWEQRQRRLNLKFPDKSLSLGLSETADGPDIGNKMVQQTTEYLENSHIRVLNIDESIQDRLQIRLTITSSDKDAVTILHHSRIDSHLKLFLHQEFERQSIPFQLKESVKVSQKGLQIKCFVKKDSIFTNTFPYYLSRVILRYLHAEPRTTPLSYLSKEIIIQWLRQISQLDNHYHPSKTEQTAAHHKQSFEVHQRQSTSSTTAPVQSDQEVKADGWFNYTIMPPNKENDDNEYLINGRFIIKNTGNISISNPVILFRVSPIDKVSLQGKFVPPNTVKSQAVQTEEAGQKGWKFIHEDWLKRAKDKGEYWVTPIQTVNLSPGNSVVMDTLQLTMKEPEPGNYYKVEAFIYFQNGKYAFSAQNQITFSF